MAKKRSSAGKSKRQVLPDRRVLEAGLHALVCGDEQTPLVRAQELIYQAFDAPSPQSRIELARKALRISADCADAHVVLGEHAGGPKAALEHFERGVAAGERALGPVNFELAVGRFWSVLETRPYMRARERLAHALWDLGRREEAVEHLREMLRLNPNDNQGIRYTLAGWLLKLERDADLLELLQRFPTDASALWAYARVLATYRQGDQAAARQLLEEARRVNPYLLVYLLGDERMPMERPPHYSLGSREEAILWAATLLPAWRSTPGASAWLRAMVEPSRQPASPPPFNPSPEVIQRLKELPRQPDDWQADFRQMAKWITIDGENVRPWILLLTSRDDNQILGNDILDESPSAEQMWTKLVEAMESPEAGPPHRPTEIQVRPGSTWQILKPHLTELGISVVMQAELVHIDFVFADMTRHLFGESEPGLLSVPGMTPELVGSFFSAAAEHYRLAPWRLVGDSGTIRVECDRFQGGPWYAIVMGQSGLTFGLALYEDINQLRKLRRNQSSDHDMVALSVTFGNEQNLSVNDLDALHRHGWPVAGPEAFPGIFRKERGMTMRPPLPWELELMEGCLRAVPRFVQEHRPSENEKIRPVVPAASGELAMPLGWAVD
ncbi:MAG: tetratricopeptide repeat protein [Planctomycetia bacterium]|nr:tetratricopeptide repeat protein [Planctomycetia bacterium]